MQILFFAVHNNGNASVVQEKFTRSMNFKFLRLRMFR